MAVRKIGKFRKELKQIRYLWCWCGPNMNEKLKRTELNGAFKRFQRLPWLLTKSDIQPPQAEKTPWQPARLDPPRTSDRADSTLQSLAE
jgi:hypothetical protein